MNLSPYEWPQSSGCLTADLLADYVAWLTPRCQVEYDSAGRADTSLSAQNGKVITPFEPRKKDGWLNVQRDLRPFAAWVVEKLKPHSHRSPYIPRKRKGQALVMDLQDFHHWVLKILEHKKQSQNRSKNNPHA
jgi:hypothetical protein